MLVGKRILLISIKFFNYENLIKQELEEMGAIVDLYDERPSNSFLSKAIIRFKKAFYARKINQYFKSICSEIENTKYNYFLLIKGEATPVFFLDFLRKQNPEIKFIYYTYDSFKNNSNGLKILSHFDAKYTFDSLDAKKYDLGFRPLFYAKDYSGLYDVKGSSSYDLSFIGTAHSDRYTISELAKNWCSKHNLNMYSFYYSPSKLLFIYKKLTEPDFKNFDERLISFKSLNHSEIVNLYKKTKAILDINHPGQNGLTMRTFETLGAGRKLITTNSNIRKYPFYNPENIWVLDRDGIQFDLAFFSTPFVPLQKDHLHTMSLRGWIEEVFGLSDVKIWEGVVK